MTTYNRVPRCGEKMLVCLLIAEARDAPTGPMYRQACERWSKKAVDAKLWELAKRGYLYTCVENTPGWLTDKGKAMLADWRQA